MFESLRAEADIAMTVKHSTFLRVIDAYFFEPKRLLACAFAFLLAYALVIAIWLSDGFQPVDFTAFWAASWLALNDTPGAIFDHAKVEFAHRIIFPDSSEIYEWLYPPTFLLFVLPLALLPYTAAYAAWVVSSFTACLWALSKFATTRWLPIALLAFPGTLMNVLTGQNGLILTALFAGASYALDRSPVLSGVLIGLISMKPQLGILWLIALIFGRYWRALIAAAGTTLALALLALISFGWEIWPEFVNRMLAVQRGLDRGLMSWIKIPTFYGGGRLLGLDITSAYAGHLVLAFGVTAIMAAIWSKRSPMAVRSAVLTLATVLVLPRLFFYDLALLAIPLTLLTMDGIRNGWHPFERPVLLLGWMAPLLGLVSASAFNIHVTPIIIFAIFLVAARRAFAPPVPVPPARTPVQLGEKCVGQS